MPIYQLPSLYNQMQSSKNRIGFAGFLVPTLHGDSGKKGLIGTAVVAHFLIPIYRGFIGRYFSFGRMEGKKKEGQR